MFGVSSDGLEAMFAPCIPSGARLVNCSANSWIANACRALQ